MCACGMQLNFFLLTVVKIQPKAVGFIVVIGRFWDALMDPLVGVMTTRTRTRWGSLKPWLAGAIAPLALSYIAIWSVPPWWDDDARGGFVTIAYVRLRASSAKDRSDVIMNSSLSCGRSLLWFELNFCCPQVQHTRFDQRVVFMGFTTGICEFSARSHVVVAQHSTASQSSSLLCLSICSLPMCCTKTCVRYRYLMYQLCISMYYIPYTSLTVHISSEQHEIDSVTMFRMIAETFAVFGGAVLSKVIQPITDSAAAHCNGSEHQGFCA